VNPWPTASVTVEVESRVASERERLGEGAIANPRRTCRDDQE
jgi:hypothetical protein